MKRTRLLGHLIFLFLWILAYRAEGAQHVKSKNNKKISDHVIKTKKSMLVDKKNNPRKFSSLSPVNAGDLSSRISNHSKSTNYFSKKNKKDFDVIDSLRSKKKYQLDIDKDKKIINGKDLEKRTTEDLMDDKLDEEIHLSEDLLTIESDCNETALIHFRLADLYWEKSKRYFFKSNDPNISKINQTDLLKQMKTNQALALVNYDTIIKKCPKYQEMVRVLFYQAKALSENDQAAAALTLYQQIIHQYPHSDWVSQSWFAIGEYYFNATNHVESALLAYIKASQDKKNPMLTLAIYKQGWCYINMGKWDMAMQRFVDTIYLTAHPRPNIDERSQSFLRREALKDYVRSYARVGSPKEAMTHFTKIAKPEEILSMLESLGGWYIDQGSYQYIEEIYSTIIEKYPNSTRKTIYYTKILDAISRTGSASHTILEVKLLVQSFNELKRYYKEKISSDITEEDKRNLEKDMKESSEMSENILRHLTLDVYKQSKSLKGSSQLKHYAYADLLFRQYLEAFPEDKENVEVPYTMYMSFYYAELLYRMKQFESSADQYDKVTYLLKTPKNNQEKEILKSAFEEAVRSYDEVVSALDRQKPPDISGNDLKEIPELKKKLLKSCQRYIDYLGNKGSQVVEVHYKMARIYYTYNYFKEAMAIFSDIVNNYSSHPVACYAANLVLDILNGQKNYLELQKTAEKYHQDSKLVCSVEDKNHFEKIAQESYFLSIKNMENEQNYSEAAVSYLAFASRYPKSDLADKAVYNASVSYDLDFNISKANEVRQYFIETYPQSSLASDVLYAIAQGYERVLEFNKASFFLEKFTERYPEDKRSKDALYTSFLYRLHLNEWKIADIDQKKYMQNNENDPQIDEMSFLYCSDMERYFQTTTTSSRATLSSVDVSKVVDCYSDYIRNHIRLNKIDDSLCHAIFKRIEWLKWLKKSKKEEIDKEEKMFLSVYEKLKVFNMEKRLKCTEHFSAYQFNRLNETYKNYLSLELAKLDPTPKGKKHFDASLNKKIKERDDLIKSYTEIVKLGVAKWSFPALYQIGELYRDCIAKIEKAPIPDKIPGYTLTEEDKNMLRSELKKMSQPILPKAIEAYSACLDKSYEISNYNIWILQSYYRLSTLDPQLYLQLQLPVLDDKLVNQLVNDWPVIKNHLLVEENNKLNSIYFPKLENNKFEGGSYE